MTKLKIQEMSNHTTNCVFPEFPCVQQNALEPPSSGNVANVRLRKRSLQKDICLFGNPPLFCEGRRSGETMPLSFLGSSSKPYDVQMDTASPFPSSTSIFPSSIASTLTTSAEVSSSLSAVSMEVNESRRSPPSSSSACRFSSLLPFWGSSSVSIMSSSTFSLPATRSSASSSDPFSSFPTVPSALSFSFSPSASSPIPLPSSPATSSFVPLCSNPCSSFYPSSSFPSTSSCVALSPRAFPGSSSSTLIDPRDSNSSAIATSNSFSSRSNRSSNSSSTDYDSRKSLFYAHSTSPNKIETAESVFRPNVNSNCSSTLTMNVNSYSSTCENETDVTGAHGNSWKVDGSRGGVSSSYLWWKQHGGGQSGVHCSSPFAFASPPRATSSQEAVSSEEGGRGDDEGREERLHSVYDWLEVGSRDERTKKRKSSSSTKSSRCSSGGSNKSNKTRSSSTTSTRHSKMRSKMSNMVNDESHDCGHSNNSKLNIAGNDSSHLCKPIDDNADHHDVVGTVLAKPSQEVADLGTLEEKRIANVGILEEKRIANLGTLEEKRIANVGILEEKRIANVGTQEEKRMPQEEKRIPDVGMPYRHLETFPTSATRKGGVGSDVRKEDLCEILLSEFQLEESLAVVKEVRRLFQMQLNKVQELDILLVRLWDSIVPLQKALAMKTVQKEQMRLLQKEEKAEKEGKAANTTTPTTIATTVVGEKLTTIKNEGDRMSSQSTCVSNLQGEEEDVARYHQVTSSSLQCSSSSASHSSVTSSLSSSSSSCSSAPSPGPSSSCTANPSNVPFSSSWTGPEIFELQRLEGLKRQIDAVNKRKRIVISMLQDIINRALQKLEAKWPNCHRLYSLLCGEDVEESYHHDLKMTMPISFTTSTAGLFADTSISSAFSSIATSSTSASVSTSSSSSLSRVSDQISSADSSMISSSRSGTSSSFLATPATPSPTSHVVSTGLGLFKDAPPPFHLKELHHPQGSSHFTPSRLSCAKNIDEEAGTAEAADDVKPKTLGRRGERKYIGEQMGGSRMQREETGCGIDEKELMNKDREGIDDRGWDGRQSGRKGVPRGFWTPIGSMRTVTEEDETAVGIGEKGGEG